MADPKQEAMAAWAANRAMQEAMWRRDNPGKIRLYLISAPDDPAAFSAEYQTELRQVIAALQAREIKADAAFMIMDSVDATGGYIGELAVLAHAVGPALGVIVGAWFQSKAGRKIRLKDGDIEVEARTIQEIEKLLDLVAEQRAKRKSQGSQ